MRSSSRRRSWPSPTTGPTTTRSARRKAATARPTNGRPDRHAVFRHFIDAEQTLEQWEERFAGTDQASTSRGIKPGAFLSATEICDEWLVPLGQTRKSMVQFWQTHRQTGDNVKERPYANLYPRLTTRSNAYRVHVVAQALRKAKKSDQRTFQPIEGDQVTAEYRGSYLVERSIDPTDPDLKDYATAVANLQDYDPLDKFYFYRISQVKQFVR